MKQVWEIMICSALLSLIALHSTASVPIIKTDTIHLQEIIVTGRKAPAVYSELSRIVTVITEADISRLPVTSLSGVLEYALSLDVRERGPMGVQSDISIRGSSFEQVLILLNGIKINDPQTGHHHMNIPVDIHQIERIEILEGPGSRIFGPYAYAGAINIITRGSPENQFRVNLSAGQNGFFFGAASAGISSGKFFHQLSVSRKESSGYRENTDFMVNSIYYQLERKSEGLSTDIQVGAMQKEFGANSFYTPVYPEQFEAVKTLFASVKNTFGRRGRVSHNLYYRRHWDRFELFRFERAQWYRGHNYHQTDVYGTEGAYTVPWRMGTSALGAELRTESILSNVLGFPMKDTIWLNREENAFYSRQKERHHLSLFAEHNFYLGRFSLSAGLLGSYSNDFGWGVFPGIDLSYNLSKELKTYFSFNKSLRLPSFTDLYYSGPTNNGNPDLRPEKADNFEAGLKYSAGSMQGHFLLFKRNGKNMIDWVRIADSLRWESRNLTEINAVGLELAVSYSFNGKENGFLDKISAGYSRMEITKQSGEYISVYALDQLNHKLVLSLHHKILKNLKGSWFLNYQDRAGTYTHFPSAEEWPYRAFLTIDTKVSMSVKSLALYLEVSNLFNRAYIDFGNLPQPRRWIRFGITHQLFN